MEQRTNEWFRARLGHITASECFVLTKDRKEPMTDEELAAYKAENPKSRVTTKTVPFSEATFTYLDRKVMENLLPLNSKSIEARNAVDDYIETHAVTNRAMEWGTLMEDEARNRYAREMSYEVFTMGFEPYDRYPNLVGGSPDGAIRQEDGIIEIKCPFQLEKHLQHVLYKTPADLKENEPEYYWQCVLNMLICDMQFCDFISYSPYVSKSKQLKVLRIPRIEEDFRLLRDRIELAVLYIKSRLEQLNIIPNIITNYE